MTDKAAAGETVTTEETDKKGETDAGADIDKDNDAAAGTDTTKETDTDTTSTGGTSAAAGGDTAGSQSSVYTLTLKNGEKVYHINGDSTTDASSIFTALDIDPDKVESVESSNGELFCFNKDADGKYQLVSKKPFESSEYIKVKLNGSDEWITIDVTDPDNSVAADIGDGNIIITDDFNDESQDATGATFKITYGDGQTAYLNNNAEVKINHANSSTATKNTIKVTLNSANHNIKLVLNGVNMTAETDNGATAERITVNVAKDSNVTLEFAGENTLGTQQNAGVIATMGKDANSIGTVTIQCAGSGKEKGTLTLYNKNSSVSHSVIGVVNTGNINQLSKIIIKDAKIIIERNINVSTVDPVITGSLENGVKIQSSSVIYVNNDTDTSTVKALIDTENYNLEEGKSGYYNTFNVKPPFILIDAYLDKGNITITDSGDSDVVTVTYFDADGTEKTVKLRDNGGVRVNQSDTTTATANTITTTLNNGKNVQLVLNGVNMANTSSATTSPITVNAGSGSTVTMELDNDNTVISNNNMPAIQTTVTGTGTLKITDENGTAGTLTTNDASKGSVKSKFDTTKCVVSTDDTNKKTTTFVVGDAASIAGKLPAAASTSNTNPVVIEQLPADVTTLTGIADGTYVKNGTANEITVNDTILAKNETAKVGTTPTVQDSLDVDISKGNVEITDNADKTITVTYYDTVDGNTVKKTALVKDGGTVKAKGTTDKNAIKTTLDNGANVNLVLDGVTMSNSAATGAKGNLIDVNAGTGSTVTMSLLGTSTLTQDNGNKAAIHKTGEGKLIIKNGETGGNVGKLTAEQTNAGSAAVIGGKSGETNIGTIEIDDADITVKKNADDKGDALGDNVTVKADSVITVDENHPIDKARFATGDGEILVAVNDGNGNIQYVIGDESYVKSQLNGKLGSGKTLDVMTLPNGKLEGIDAGTTVKNSTGNTEIAVNDTVIAKNESAKVGTAHNPAEDLTVDLTKGNVEISDNADGTITVTYYDDGNVKKTATLDNDKAVTVDGKSTSTANTVKTTLNNANSKANVVLKDVVVESSNSPVEAILATDSVMNLTLDGENKLTTSGTDPVIYKHADGNNNDGKGTLNITGKKDATGAVTGSLTAEQTNADNTSDAIGGDDNGAIVIDNANITVKKASTTGDALGDNVTVKADSVITVDDKHPIDKARFATGEGEMLVSAKDEEGNTKYIVGKAEYISDNLPTDSGNNKDNPIVIEKLPEGTALATGLPKDKYVKNGTDNEVTVNDTIIPAGNTYKVGETHDPSKTLDVDIAKGNVVIDDKGGDTITVTYYETVDGEKIRKSAAINNNGTVNVTQSDSETPTDNTITTKLAKDGNNVNVVLNGVNMKKDGTLIDVEPTNASSTVTLALKGDNKLTNTNKSGETAAIHKSGEGKLVIKDGEEEGSEKTGALLVEQNDGKAAAIGGNAKDTSTENISVESGFVAVVRGDDAVNGGAAIGAAKGGTGDKIAIKSPASAVLPVTGSYSYDFSEITSGSGVITTAGNYVIGPVEVIKEVVSTELDPNMTIISLPDGEIDGIPEGMSVTNKTGGDISVNGVTVADGATYRIPYTPVFDPSAAVGKYYIIEGKDSEWTTGSKDGLVFKLNSNALIKVLIDGVEVEFTVDEDGNVTIDAEVLAALDPGKHKIEFVFSDGSCSTHFTVE